MILAWMLYTFAVTLLFALAAWLLEVAIRTQARPVRGVWVAALVSSIAFPMVARLELSPEPAYSVAGQPQDADLGPSSVAGPVVEWLGSSTRPITPQPLRGGGADLDPLVVALWATISGILAFFLAASQLALSRRRREWIPQEVDGRSVLVSADTGPAVLGIIRSSIVLPEWILRSGAGDRAIVLAHEEEHIRAGDPRLLGSVLLLAIALPWNLPLWWIWKRLRRAVEIDCDLRVFARGVGAREYSDLLVKVSECGIPHRVAVVALSESSSFLETRIRLMFTPKASRWRTRAACAGALAAMLVVTACWIQEPAGPTTGPLTLLITPSGFHIEDPSTEAVPIIELPARLKEELSGGHELEVLNVREREGMTDSGYEIAKRAACEAGVRLIYYSEDFASGAEVARPALPTQRVEHSLTLPCDSYTPSAEVQRCVADVEGRPWVESLVGPPQVEPMREDWAQITGIAAVRTESGEMARIGWTCDLFRDENRGWHRRYLSFQPVE